MRSIVIVVSVIALGVGGVLGGVCGVCGVCVLGASHGQWRATYKLKKSEKLAKIAVGGGSK